MQTNRLFDIVYILLDRKQTTAKELAERFGVSQRKIYRDIDTLSLSGIPVYTEKAKAAASAYCPTLCCGLVQRSRNGKESRLGVRTPKRGHSDKAA